MTSVGRCLVKHWHLLEQRGKLRKRAQKGIVIDLRVEPSVRGGMHHTAVLINAYVDLWGRSYHLPTQCPLSSASPEEVEELILGLIERLKKVAKKYKKKDIEWEGE